SGNSAGPVTFTGVPTVVQTGTTTSGGTAIPGLASTANLFPGMLVQGPGITSGTTISSLNPASVNTTANTITAQSSTITVADSTGVVVGMLASAGTYLLANTTVTAIAGNTITLSIPALTSGSSVPITFSASIILSNSATATAIGTLLSFTG